MIYEGNDFRSAKSDAERADGDWLTRFSTYWKQSPIIGPLDSAMIRTFGSMRISAPVNGAEVLDWLPLAVPPGPEGRRYAFSPKQLADLYRPAAEFAANRKWQNTRRILEETKALCDRAPCHLVIIYAPTKAHVVLPWVTSAGNERDSAAGLASQRPPTPEKVRAFLALGEDEENLPEASQLAADLMHHADGRESTVADWCHKASVPFISMTPPLREACAEGKQVYFTYDQHWTPIGHEVAAAAIAVRLKDLLANADSAAGSRSP